MHVYIDDRFMSVSENKGILALRWKKDTANLNDEDFKNEALKFIGVVKKIKSKWIMVNMREFYYNLNSELIAWRNKYILTVYNEIGVEKFAFISKKQIVMQEDPSNKFITRYFLTEQEAENWFNS